MDPEVKETLEHLEEVSEENNRMIRKIYRTTRFAQFFAIVKWAIVIGVAIGAFYYLQPVFDKIDSIYNALTNNHLPSFQDLLNRLK
jgi:hypothetical protein